MVDKIEQGGAVTKVWFDDVLAGWERWLLLRSDAHHDSAYCNRALEKKHLDLAVSRGALIMDAGDLFDAMQGRFDPRRSYEDLRPEFAVSNYYDAICDDAYEFYKPYADNFILMGKGNHETSVIKNVNIDLTSRLTGRLNREAGGRVVCGGYGGYVILYFSDKGNRRSSIKIKYFHGSGGEAPVTKGAINAYRQMVVYPDADIIWNGHSHNEYVISSKRERISTKGSLYYDINLAIRTPGYKDDYQNGMTGWEVERGGSPKPQGAVWVKLSFDGQRVRAQAMEDIE